MTRGEIRQAIKDEVDDQTIADILANCGFNVPMQRYKVGDPPEDRDQTFDYWDYLKTEQPYTTVATKRNIQCLKTIERLWN